MTSIIELRQRVAQYAVDDLDVENREWETGVALLGLLTMGDYDESVRAVLERSAATQTSEGLLGYGWKSYPKEWMQRAGDELDGYKPTINCSILARCICEHPTATDEERFRRPLRSQYEFYERSRRTADGGIVRRLDEPELYTETLHFLTPFFLEYGALTDERAPIEAAVEQVDVHVDRLQDPSTGLFRHVWRETPNSYPSSYFWSRANGWAVAGLLDTLLLLPDDHPARSDTRDALERALDTIVERQDNTGYWHVVLDDTRSRLETSGTLIFAYTLQCAVDQGVFDKQSYETAAADAMEVCTGVVDTDGAVRRVSKPPANASTPFGATLYGQGWFLLASSRFV